MDNDPRSTSKKKMVKDNRKQPNIGLTGDDLVVEYIDRII
jgi:hypothetical protein